MDTQNLPANKQQLMPSKESISEVCVMSNMPAKMKAALLKIILHTSRVTETYGAIGSDIAGVTEAYAFELEGYTLEQIAWAFEVARRSERKFPSIAALLELLCSPECPGIAESERDSRRRHQWQL